MRPATGRFVTVLLAVLAGACAAPDPPPSTPAPLGPEVVVRPDSTPVELGRSAAIRINVHCGWERAVVDFDRRLWRVRGGPPADVRVNPFVTGTITKVGPAAARFEAADGMVLLLERLPGGLEIVPCR